ncbi:thioredoxin family protein [Cellulophaga fucicola]|uniref:Thioredoxin-like domain-containing protein n=1 Tax=Cellulophaga fucicola TaxID=76595 RepID=A0A1K1PKY9_9FLAO|nr:thioredoxin family protein [Cellulophaga fucicola]SFW48300.1 Thioredoxin-like domain-containing protein [Cellulophaga fucicola]
MIPYFKKIIFCVLTGCLFGSQLAAQQDELNWLSFNQLEDSLAIKPKKVLIHFYADWCGLCHKMDRKTYKNSNVINTLSKDYYVVKMNIETTEKITFGSTTYKNENAKKVNSIHQIPLLMASRKNKPFSLPAIVILDENFTATSRYFQYLNAKQLLKTIQ